MNRALWPFLASRVIRTLITMWLGVTLIFFAIRVVPGDPAEAVLGHQSTLEGLATLAAADGPRSIAVDAICPDAGQAVAGRSRALVGRGPADLADDPASRAVHGTGRVRRPADRGRHRHSARDCCRYRAQLADRLRGPPVVAHRTRHSRLCHRHPADASLLGMAGLVSGRGRRRARRLGKLVAFRRVAVGRWRRRYGRLSDAPDAFGGARAAARRLCADGAGERA